MAKRTSGWTPDAVEKAGWEQAWAEFVDDLSGLLWNDPKGRSWEQIAGEAKLCLSTVRNLATRETKNPHLRTVWKLLPVLGFRMAFVAAGADCQPEEVDLRALRGKVVRLRVAQKGRKRSS